ncbi:MAG: NAD(+) synthase [Myxococcales bacterium]|nr:NAD(+) synthase [Myxococcales bacterium]
MRLVKIGLASVNATVGAVRDNTDRCLAHAHAMAADDVTIGVFPEQVIGGYAAEDLVQWRGFVASQRRELERFAAETRALDTAFALGLTLGAGGDLYNAAALVHHGRVVVAVAKEKLPTYNIFYEARTLSRGTAYMDVAADGAAAGPHAALRVRDCIVAFDWGTVALEVCEDVWSPDGPMRRRCYSGAELVCNLSASPYRAGIDATRREMLATRAADNQCTIAYANLVGANDGLIFDGGGIVNQNGRPTLEAPRFREGYAAAVVDLDRTERCRREASTWRTDCETFRATSRAVPRVVVDAPTANRSRLGYPLPTGYEPGLVGRAEGATFPSYFLPARGHRDVAPRDALCAELYEALALGVADYFRKTGAFERIGLALSGGRDSCLTLLVARRAVDILFGAGPDGRAPAAVVADRLWTFYMPTRFSSEATRDAAARLAADVGARFFVSPIEEAFLRECAATEAMLNAPATEGATTSGAAPAELTSVTRQNVQARRRGARMWNWANSGRALFLQTGNMSEKSVGYTTVGGDLEGALSVIGNLPKTVVMALLAHLERRLGHPGIASVLGTTAGPELAADQSGENELMPFPVLDACLYLHGAEKLSREEVAAVLPTLFPELAPADLERWAAKFARLFTQSIFKWVQAPLVLHVGALDLDRERALQLPVVQRTEWT